MKIAGIIAEYNPFHNGHAHHIQKTCEIYGATNIICVMSGNFTQRGEPAIADKWVRTRMALLSGADIVIELPFLCATQSAEGFATGGVRLLSALNCVDLLSFGSECNDVGLMTTCAKILHTESSAYRTALHAQLKTGTSFALARGIALSEMLGQDLSGFLMSSNNILAIEYIKAILQNNSSIAPVSIKRRGADYLDATMQSQFSSAMALRTALAISGMTGEVLANTPETCHPFYDFLPLTDMQRYFTLILYKIRTMSIHEIANICDVSEGLEYRIKECAKTAETLEQLILAIKSKRYAYTRIKRILLYCLFDVTKEITSTLGETPLYARVLGFRKEKQDLLSLLAAKSSIPLFCKPSDFDVNSELLAYDISATDIYALLNKKVTPGGRDYTQKLIVV